MNKSNETKSVLYITLSGFFFGLLGYFGLSLTHEKLSVYNMIFWRFFVSTLIMGIIFFPQLKKQFSSYSKMVILFFHGLLFYGPATLIYFFAAQKIGSGLAMVIFFTYPSMVMLLNFLIYRQKASKTYLIAIFMIFLGLLFLVKGSPFEFNVMGITLSIVSAIIYAIYIIVGKKSTSYALISTFMVCLGSTIAGLVGVLMSNTFFIPTGVNVWMLLAGISIICTILPTLFLLKGLEHISSLKASILSVLEPVFLVVFGIVLLNEYINAMQFLGIIILLSGALLTVIV